MKLETALAFMLILAGVWACSESASYKLDCGDGRTMEIEGSMTATPTLEKAD